MNRDVIDVWLERAILVVCLATLVALPLLFGGRPQPVSGGILDLLLVEPFLVALWLTLIALGLWLVRLWVVAKPRLLFPPISWAILAFALYAAGRYLSADIEYVARQEVLRIVVYASLFFIIVNNLHRQEATQVITLTMVTLAMLISFYAMYQFLADSDRVWHLTKPYRHRGSGTYISPNHLGGFLEMLLPLGLAYTLMGRLKILTKILVGYACAAVIGGIAVTMSRGTWIAVAFGLLLFFILLVFYKPYRLAAIVAFVLLAGSLAFILPSSTAFKSRVKQLYTGGRLDDDARFALWRPTIQVWKENVWWGAGPAHFDYRFTTFRPEEVQARADRA
ncbi:hypothetical protein EG834_19070, partial [bacterium]|nr:hypothetical protein [bacterium]